jgi:uncharacterized coiled-coil DUF342 family protein
LTSKIAETEKEKNKLLNEISELKQASEETASRLEKKAQILKFMKRKSRNSKEPFPTLKFLKRNLKE